MADKENVSVFRWLVVFLEAAGMENGTAVGCVGLLFALGAIGILFFIYKEIDSTGRFSHSIETTITAQTDWFVGESKECSSISLAENVVYDLDCDEGPRHQVTLTIYGRTDQPEYARIHWKCIREASGFICYELHGDPR